MKARITAMETRAMLRMDRLFYTQILYTLVVLKVLMWDPSRFGMIDRSSSRRLKVIYSLPR